MRIIFNLVLLIMIGCTQKPIVDEHTSASRSTIRIVVDVAEEHLGHNVNETSGHSIWCDGCRAHEVVSGDPIVIYWTNTNRGTSYKFVVGASYEVSFDGVIGRGVMGFEGQCIDLTQVKEVKEL